MLYLKRVILIILPAELVDQIVEEAMDGISSDTIAESDLGTGLRPFFERILDVPHPQPTSLLAALLCAKGECVWHHWHR